MKSLRLYKREKLCSATVIDSLWGHSAATASSLAYPLRAVWIDNPRHDLREAPVRFLISVPKRRLRHAVDRVLMRRRIREAYRLHHQEFPPQPSRRRLCLALVYVSDRVLPYQAVEKALLRLLPRIARAPEDTPENTSLPAATPDTPPPCAER